METKTRQIVLDSVCDLFASKSFVVHYVTYEGKKITNDQMQIRRVKIVRETPETIYCEQQADPNGYYGWSDRPPLGKCIIKKDTIDLIAYKDANIKSTPGLQFYRKDDKVQILIDDIRNWEEGKITPTIWRDAKVLDTGMVYPKERGLKPYPYIQYEVIRTYWKGDSNRNGEFYDKPSVERAYSAREVRFAEGKNFVSV